MQNARLQTTQTTAMNTFELLSAARMGSIFCPVMVTSASSSDDDMTMVAVEMSGDDNPLWQSRVPGEAKALQQKHHLDAALARDGAMTPNDARVPEIQDRGKGKKCKEGKRLGLTDC